MAADTGPIGGDLSHEFVILADTGESKIYSDKRIFDIDISKHNDADDSIKELREKYDAFYAVTDNKFKKEDFEKKVKKENQLVTKGIEVGHIFYFGDKYSKPLKCSVDLQDGKKVDVKMGSYGIGVSRLVGAIIESKFTNNVMRWPESVAPFEVAIIPSLQKNDKSNYLKSKKIYNLLIKNIIPFIKYVYSIICNILFKPINKLNNMPTNNDSQLVNEILAEIGNEEVPESNEEQIKQQMIQQQQMQQQY
mgnify:CR=1 FL=1